MNTHRPENLPATSDRDGKISGADVVVDEPLYRHCSLQVGGKADFFIRAATLDILNGALGFCREHRIDFFIMGAGSNLLMPDAGYRGMVIKMDMRGIQFSGSTVIAGAGAKLSRVVHESVKNNLTGLEFAAGIPGTIGGATLMNAGAFGGQIGENIRRVTAIDRGGRSQQIPRDDIQFGYRSCSLKDGGLIVTEVELALNPGDQEAIRKRLNEVRELRKKHEPSEPSAGCVFKNPTGDSAGRLIDSCGMKGLRQGKAEVSEKHANYIINRGGATYEDVTRLMETIIQKVREKYNVILEPEIIDLGKL